MNKKLLSTLLIVGVLSLALIGCSTDKKVNEFLNLRQQAVKQCEDNRNGELIFFGEVYEPTTMTWNYESVCYKEDERHFYYESIQKQ